MFKCQKHYIIIRFQKNFNNTSPRGLSAPITRWQADGGRMCCL